MCIVRKWTDTWSFSIITFLKGTQSMYDCNLTHISVLLGLQAGPNLSCQDRFDMILISVKKGLAALQDTYMASYGTNCTGVLVAFSYSQREMRHTKYVIAWKWCISHSGPVHHWAVLQNPSRGKTVWMCPQWAAGRSEHDSILPSPREQWNLNRGLW